MKERMSSSSMPSRSTLSLLASVLLAAVASGQAQPPGGWSPTNPPFHHNDIDWPSTIGTGQSFREVAPGEFTGLTFVSDFVRKGGEVGFVFLPHLTASVSALTTLVGTSLPPISAIGTFPGGHTDGHASLLAADSTGLWEYEMQMPDPPGPAPSATRTLVHAGDWISARHVAAVDLDGDLDQDLIGITDDGLGIIVQKNVSGVFAAPSTYAVPDAAVQVVAFDYVPGGELELVVLTVEELRILTAGGGYVTDIRLAYSGGAIAVVESATGPFLAWVVREANDGFFWLHRIYEQSVWGSPVALLVPFSESGPAVDLDVAGLSSGDFDADGRGDLAFSIRNHHQALVLLQREDKTFSVDPDDDAYVLFDLSEQPAQAAPNNEATYGFANHANNGGDTIIAPVQSRSALVVLSWQSPAQLVYYGEDPVISPRSCYSDGETRDTLTLEFAHLPNEILEYDRLQVILWEQPDPDANDEQQYVQPDALVNETFQIEEPTPQNPEPYACSGLNIAEFELAHPIATGAPLPHYYLQMRGIDLNAQDRIIAASWDMIVGYTRASPTYLEGLAYPQEPLEIDTICDVQHAGGAEIGAIVVLDIIPEFVPDTTPNFGVAYIGAEYMIPACY